MRRGLPGTPAFLLALIHSITYKVESRNFSGSQPHAVA
jgi:hypothetical protein